MNRITDKILHGMLILMIGLSFYLTYLIWVSPASHETSLEESLGNNRTEETSLKTKEEVFLPLKLRYQKEDTNQETQNEALLKAIQKELHQTTYSEGEVKTYSKQSDYQRATTMTSGMELFYAFSFPFNYIKTIYDFLDINLYNEDILEKFKEKCCSIYHKNKRKYFKIDIIKFMYFCIDIGYKCDTIKI